MNIISNLVNLTIRKYLKYFLLCFIILNGCGPSINIQKLEQFKSLNKKTLFITDDEDTFDNFKECLKDNNLNNNLNISIKLDNYMKLDLITKRYVLNNFSWDRIFYILRDMHNKYILYVYVNGDSLQNLGSYYFEDMLDTVFTHYLDPNFAYENINKERLKAKLIAEIEQLVYVPNNGYVNYGAIYYALNIIYDNSIWGQEISQYFINKINKYNFGNIYIKPLDQEYIFSPTFFVSLKKTIENNYPLYKEKLKTIYDWVSEKANPVLLKENTLNNDFKKVKINFETNFKGKYLSMVKNQFIEFKDSLFKDLANHFIDYIIPSKISIMINKYNEVNINADFELNTKKSRLKILMDYDNTISLDFYEIILGDIRTIFYYKGYFENFETTFNKMETGKFITFNYSWNLKGGDNDKLNYSDFDLRSQLELKLWQLKLRQYYSPFVLYQDKTNNVSELIKCFENEEGNYIAPYFRLHLSDIKNMADIKTNMDYIKDFFDF